MYNSLWSVKAESLNASDRSQQVKEWGAFECWIFFAGLCEVMEHFQPLQIFPPPSKLPHILNKNNPLILYLSFLKHIRPKFLSMTSSRLYWYDLNTLVFYTCCKNLFLQSDYQVITVEQGFKNVSLMCLGIFYSDF